MVATTLGFGGGGVLSGLMEDGSGGNLVKEWSELKKAVGGEAKRNEQGWRGTGWTRVARGGGVGEGCRRYSPHFQICRCIKIHPKP